VSGVLAPAHDDLINLPYVTALERLHGRDVYLRVLAPPYPGIGIGTLHVVRAEDKDGGIELVVTYDDYERLKPSAVAGAS
jgi:hypothetical protein